MKDLVWIAQTYFLLPEIMILLFLVISSFIVLACSANKFYFKLFYISVTLIFCVLFVTKTDQVLGKPYPGEPVVKVEVLGEKKIGQSIHLWVSPVGESETRLYRIPYTEQNMTKIKQAQGNSQLGPKVISMRNGEIEFYDFSDLKFFEKH